MHSLERGRRRRDCWKKDRRLEKRGKGERACVKESKRENKEKKEEVTKRLVAVHYYS